ncbi:MAG TPA: hypothetical protein VFM99_11675, partial [Chitinophagales bacterium]|nr:hypothetical protein [Chitinophagales bacterium]
MKFIFLISIVFFCCTSLEAQDQFPVDQLFDSVLEVKINELNYDEKDANLGQTIYKLLVMVDSLNKDHYYYKGKLYDLLGTIYFNIDQP